MNDRIKELEEMQTLLKKNKRDSLKMWDGLLQNIQLEIAKEKAKE